MKNVTDTMGVDEAIEIWTKHYGRIGYHYDISNTEDSLLSNRENELACLMGLYAMLFINADPDMKKRFEEEFNTTIRITENLHVIRKRGGERKC